MENPVLDNIKERRTIYNFKDEPVDDEKIEKILEAARWSPSWTNTQPWRFVVVKDEGVKREISEILPEVFRKGIRNAAVTIVVLVNPEEDKYHCVEDGAAATQNMALAAKSLDLGSTWIGVFDTENEDEVRDVLDISNEYRVISLVPVGVPKKVPEKERKELSSLILKEV